MDTSKKLIFRGSEVDALLGGCKSGRYARQDPTNLAQYDPTWPLPIKLSARSVGYLASEIEAWLASRPRVRDINQHETPETEERQIAMRCGRETAQETRQQADTYWKSRPRTSIVKQAAEE